jgi:FkbM family methyltransferase
MNLHLHRLGIEVVFDVGANAGQFASRLRASGYRGRIISFEPLSGAHAELGLAARGDSQWEVAPRCAVGARNGSAVINIAEDSLSSSLLPLLDSQIDAAPKSQYVGKEEVEIITLSHYISRAYPDGIPRFALKIDTRGFETAVLDGLGNQIDKCRIILIEVPLYALYQGAANFLSLYGRLETNGLRCVGMSPGHRHPVSRDAVEADLLFVRYDAYSTLSARDAFCLFTSIPPRISRQQAHSGIDIGPEYQRECVRSWVAAGFKVISLNPACEADAVAAMDLPLDVMVIEGDRKPTISNFITEIRKFGADFSGIINADCNMLYYPEFSVTLRAGASDGVIMAERIEMINGQVPVIWSSGGFDMFLFPVRQLTKIDESPFSIGGPWWDYWFPFALAATGLKIRKLSLPLLTHFRHEAQWTVDEWYENGQALWRDVRRWRFDKPEIVSGLDDEIGKLWSQDALNEQQIVALAERIKRWFDEQLWDPAEEAFSVGMPTTMFGGLRLHVNGARNSIDQLKLCSTILSAKEPEASKFERIKKKIESSSYRNATELPADFDPAFYILSHADLFEHEVDPYEHFVNHGRHEKRRWDLAEEAFTVAGVPTTMLDALRHENQQRLHLARAFRSLNLRINQLESLNKQQQEALSKITTSRDQLESLNKRQQEALKEITSSTVWWLSEPLRIIGRAIKRRG